MNLAILTHVEKMTEKSVREFSDLNNTLED